MNDEFMKTVKQRHDIYPGTNINMKRTVSLDSSLDAYLDTRDTTKENTIAIPNAVSSLSVTSESSESDRLTSLREIGWSGSINSSIKGFSFSKCSDIYVGCVINNASSDSCRPERDFISSSGFVDFDNDTETVQLSALRYDIEKTDLPSSIGCSQDHALQNIIDNTNLILASWRMTLFEKTPAYELSWYTLSRRGAIFIIGNLGDGKTMISRKLMEDMRKKNTILLELNARNPISFETLVNGKRDTVVFIDDFLGKEYLDVGLLEMWTCRFSLMEDMVQAGNVQFILATRKDILEEAKSSLKSFEFFHDERIVDIALCDLSEVKERIMMRHVKTSSIFVLEEDALLYFPRELEKRIIITSDEIKEISKIDTPIGYPLCCYLFTTNAIWANKGKAFFQNPVLYIKWEIERLEWKNKNRYYTLAVILLCGGKALYYDISSNRHSEMFLSAVSKVSETCEIPLKGATVIRISNILASSGTFLRSTSDGGCIFSHDAIMEATALAYCTKGLKDIIELCPFKFILEMVVTNSNDTPDIINRRERLGNNCKIEIGIRDFDLLANRFVSEILRGNVLEVSRHKALLDSIFLDCFFAIIKKSKKENEVLTARCNSGFGDGLMFFAAVNEEPRVELLERLLKYHSRNEKNAMRKLTCFSALRRHNDYLEDAMSRALHTSCMLGRKQSCDVLIQFNARATPGLLSTAMQSQNVEIIQSLLQKYKWSNKQKQHALLKACKIGSIELYGVMMQYVETKWGEVIICKCLLESVRSGNGKLLDNILAKGCDVNYRGDFKRCALHEACIGAHEALVRRLLRVPNIDINAMDVYGYTALKYAVEYNLDNIVNILKHQTEMKVSVSNVWFGLVFNVTSSQTGYSVQS